MIITDFYIKNAIQFYNGMGLKEVRINDMHRFNKRIIFIRGGNGSGKTTLESFLTPMPDNKNHFLPNTDGEKYLRIIDDIDTYDVNIVYPVHSNGDRGTTKAYIRKNGEELNASGNVSTYKDLIAMQFKLDNNFEALSKLSSEDKGIVNKSPGERKRYFSFIIDELSDYNAMLKTFNKQSSKFSTLLDQVLAKLNNIGNPELLKAELAKLTDEKVYTNKCIDNFVFDLGELKNTVSKLNSEETKNEYNKLANALLELNTKNEQLDIIIDIIKDRDIESINRKIYELQEDSKVTMDFLKESEATKIRLKSVIYTKYEMIKSIENQQILASTETLSEVQASIDELKSWIINTEELFTSLGFNPESDINSDRLKKLYENFIDIDNQIDIFKSSITATLYESLMKDTPSSVEGFIKRYNERHNNLPYTQDELEIKLMLLDEKPSDCNVSNCPFLTRLSKVVLDREDVVKYLNEYKKLQEEFSNIEAMKQEFDNYMEAKMKLNNIHRLMFINSRETSALGLKKFEIVKDVIDYIDYSESYSHDIQKLISIADLIDEYKIKVIAYNKTLEQSVSLSHNDAIISELQNDINIKTEEFNNACREYDIHDGDLERYTELLDMHTKALDALLIHNENSKTIENISLKRKAMEDDFLKISAYELQMRETMDKVNNHRGRLEAIDSNIYRINHLLQSRVEYEQQYNIFIEKYNKIETYKRFCNPSKEGIQVAFIEMYMYDIIEMCNKLLSMILDSEFVLQQCEINESTFKIPCLGSGIKIDDISSMSSGQRAIIGTVLSFAIIRYSSSKYNVIRLDEVDAELDEYNRRALVQVINSLLDIMHIEQLFIVSHNEEFDMDDSAIIELSHKGQRLSGNIIWSYFDHQIRRK